jgi:biofilm PGA synthesis N-glycosyltransferase PgaC
MLFNIASRLGFMLLLVAALSIDAFVFNPIWLIPPAIAMLLNLRLALSMKDKSASDLLYSALFLPAEMYMWIRMGHFVSAWTQFLAKSDQDNWAAQANAEKGKGSAYVMPLVVLLAVMGGAIYAWSQQSLSVQSAILSLGWPILYIATIAQTVFMLRKLVRRHRGFAV